MARDLHLPSTYSCPTWDTADLPHGNRVNDNGIINDISDNDWSGNDMHRDHFSTVAVAMTNECIVQTSLDLSGVDLPSVAAIGRLGHQIDLPKQQMPAFAPGLPLAVMLLWKHKGFKHLC